MPRPDRFFDTRNSCSKRLFQYLLFCFCLGSVMAQDLSKSYKITEQKEFGYYYDGSPISVKTFSFNFPCYDKIVDTVLNKMYFTVREKDGSGKFYKNNGYQYSLNLSNDSIEWINDVRKFDISKIQDPLIISSDVNSAVFNKSTGLEKLQHKGKIFYADGKYKVGLYYSGTGTQKTVYAVNLEDGQPLYSAEIPNEYDLVEVLKLNDSLVCISSSGLYCLDIRSGLKWKVQEVTGEGIKGKLLQSIINPNAFRVQQNSYFMSSSEDVISQICSNILYQNDLIYFAGKNNLYAITIQGEIKWKVDISAYQTSKSALFLEKGKLYLLNLGVASFKENQVVYGSPYVMQVEPLDGKVNYQNPLPMFNYPIDFQISKELVLGGKNNLYFITLETGKYFYEIDVNELRYGNFLEFVNGDDYYVEKEGYFVPLNFINDNVVYFRSSHGKIYGVESGKIQYEYHESELYKYDKSFQGYKFIQQKFTTYVLNNNFELSATFNMVEPAFVTKDKLFYFNGRKIHVLTKSTLKKF